MNTTDQTETVNTAAAEELPAFGHTWPCQGCGVTVEGYKVLCDQCDEC